VQDALFSVVFVIFRIVFRSHFRCSYNYIYIIFRCSEMQLSALLSVLIRSLSTVHFPEAIDKK